MKIQQPTRYLQNPTPDSRSNRRGRRPGRRAGFSLIEILAAMAILMMIVVIMGIIFRDTNRSWALGTSRVLNTTTGRAAIDMIAQDLQYAVADDLLTFYAGPERQEGSITAPFGGSKAKFHEISFVSLQNNLKRDSSGNPLRTAFEVSYFVKADPANPNRYQLRRTVAKGSIASNPDAHCYKDPDWYDTRLSGFSAPALADNVACLQFHCVSTNSGGQTQTFTEYDSTRPPHANLLPQYVDIYLEILDDRAAKQLADMARMQARGINPQPQGGSMEAFLEQNIKRYTKRVFFRNRDGYKPGR